MAPSLAPVPWQNYACGANLKAVLQFLEQKEDQISGVRDRCEDGDAIDEAKNQERIKQQQHQQQQQQQQQAEQQQTPEITWTGTGTETRKAVKPVRPEAMLSELRSAVARDYPQLLAQVDADIESELAAKQAEEAERLAALEKTRALPGGMLRAWDNASAKKQEMAHEAGPKAPTAGSFSFGFSL